MRDERQNHHHYHHHHRRLRCRRRPAWWKRQKHPPTSPWQALVVSSTWHILYDDCCSQEKWIAEIWQLFFHRRISTNLDASAFINLYWWYDLYLYTTIDSSSTIYHAFLAEWIEPFDGNAACTEFEPRPRWRYTGVFNSVVWWLVA